VGARPSSFKQGGGFLNGVDGVISDYTWTDEFNGKPFEAGKIKGSDGKSIDKPHSLNLALSVRVDGADEDTTTTIKAAGDFDAYEVSEDGHVLTAADGGECNISANSATGKLLASLIQAGFPETLFSDNEDSIDLTPMVGTRVRFIQRTDVQRTKDFGKQKGKDGKLYDRKDLVIDNVYDLPGAAEAPSKGKGTKAPVKGAKGKPAAEPSFDVTDFAGPTLKSVLDAKGGTIEKPKLGMAVLGFLMKNKKLDSDQRDEIRNWLTDDDNLATLVEEGLITFNKKKGQIALAESDEEA